MELLKLIDKQLSRTAHKAEDRSLWELACSTVYWLKLAHKDHPLVSKYMASKQAVAEYLHHSNVVKPWYRWKMDAQ
jgi:hypothetical protein